MTNREFYEVWNNAESLKAAAEKAGMRVASCSQKAARLRMLGVPMKLFKQSTSEGKRNKDEFLAQFRKPEAVQP